VNKTKISPLVSQRPAWNAGRIRTRAGSKSNTLIIVIVLLLVVGLPVCTCGGCVASVFLGLHAAIKTSEPYRHGLAEAQKNAQVREFLGEPMAAGYFVNGSINLENDGGQCDMTVPISGPKGSGTIRIRGTRVGGTWSYEELSAEANGHTVDLLP
jgi:hypothetical protein